MKKFLALTGLIVACSLPFAAQSLECSVKPKVTSIEAPHSYMFVGNSYTYYSSGLAGAVNGLAKAAGTAGQARSHILGQAKARPCLCGEQRQRQIHCSGGLSGQGGAQETACEHRADGGGTEIAGRI